MRSAAIKATLLSISIGYTRVVGDSVATRWSDDAFEVGTVGREHLHINEAVDRIRAAVARTGAPQDVGGKPATTEVAIMKTKTTELELSNGIEGYIEHLTAIGKKASTVGTAKRTMALFEEGLGATKVIAKIMPVHVAGFFTSEAATTLKGKPRAKASILQIRRIVRGALVHWHEQGHLASVPVPKEDRRYLEPRKNGKATAEPAAETAAETQAEPTVATAAETQGEPTTEPAAVAAEAQPEGEREFVACHKTQQRRAVELCQQKGCISKVAAKQCPHWQQWLAEGKV